MGLSTLRQFWAIRDARGRYYTGGPWDGASWWTEDRRSPYLLRYATEGRARKVIREALQGVGTPELVDVKQALLIEEVPA
jgi:hypothetical protein